jgi:hypothetical protein
MQAFSADSEGLDVFRDLLHPRSEAWKLIPTAKTVQIDYSSYFSC